MNKIAKPVDFTNPWLIIQPVKKRIYFAMFLLGISSFSTIAILACFAAIFDSLLKHPHQWPWLFTGAAIALTIINYLMRINAFKQSHIAAFRLESLLREQLAKKCAQISLGTLQQHGSGALSKVIFDDVKELHVFVADSTPFYGRAYILPLLTIIALFILDWRLALASLLMIILCFGLMAFFMKDNKEKTLAYNQARERVSSSIVEFLQAMPVVRTFDTGSTTFSRYQAALGVYLKLVYDWYRSSKATSLLAMALFTPLPTLLLIFWLGAMFILQGSLSFSTWLAVLFLCSGLALALQPVMMLQHMIERIKLHVERIQQYLHLEIMPQVASTSFTPSDSSVVFHDVSFAYQPDQPVLTNISFTGAAGSVTALVGPSGAGKTTVARLIPRFWDVSTGKVLIGGVDVRQLTSEQLMQQVSFVFQDTFLFATSIFENIRLGKPQASEQEVINAAKAAQADEFISQLPQGYQSQAGDRGIFLSGGQRQRITIARAILQNSPILVLDEATSFADPENEAAIMLALSELMRNKTVLLVAHRLNTIQNIEQILVFDQGKLTGSGTHQQLLDDNATYQRLWHNYNLAQQWIATTQESQS